MPTCARRVRTSPSSSELKRRIGPGFDDRSRATKRARTGPAAATTDHTASTSIVSPHPLGVRPLGMKLVSKDQGTSSMKRLGIFSGLGEGVLLKLLEWMDARSLARMGSCSRAMYAFAFHDDLWRTLVLTDFGGQFEWRESWRKSYFFTACGGDKSTRETPCTPRVRTGVYSDLLFHSWLCKSAAIRPSWTHVDNIQRVRGLSVAEFVERFESKNVPAIISDAADGWKAVREWSLQRLDRDYGQLEFSAGGYMMKLSKYLRYMKRSTDDQCIYLFDKRFAETAPDMAAAYSVPPYFSGERDLFSAMGEERRPDYRWLIMGPGRSGSTFHKDPNGTSAWNACVIGKKKWILLPPHAMPPGVHASSDGADVTAPVSLVEWFLNFYNRMSDLGVTPVECIQRPGDVVFVPCGWWHCVLNLEPSVAITQNYVSEVNLQRVLAAIRNPDLVSGVPRPRRQGFRAEFLKALEQKHPGIHREAMDELKAKESAKKASLARLFDGDDGDELGDEREQEQAAEEFRFSFSVQD